MEGLIFTLVWDYDFKEDEAYVDEIIQIFKEQNAQICLVELRADLSERLIRNKAALRLKHKPSKRNLEQSEKSIHYFEANYRMHSYENEFENKAIFQIDNTNLEAIEVAKIIVEKFDL